MVTHTLIVVWIIYFISILFLLLYRFFDEAQDEAYRDRFKKPFLWLSPKFLNSGTKGIAFNNKDNWTKALGYTIPEKYRDRFYRSWFVAFTDGEHLFQAFKNWCIAIIVGILSSGYIIYLFSPGIFMTIMYSIIVIIISYFCMAIFGVIKKEFTNWQ